jgi:hypothetical protein
MFFGIFTFSIQETDEDLKMELIDMRLNTETEVL